MARCRNAAISKTTGHLDFAPTCPPPFSLGGCRLVAVILRVRPITAAPLGVIFLRRLARGHDESADPDPAPDVVEDSATMRRRSMGGKPSGTEDHLLHRAGLFARRVEDPRR